MPATNTFPRPLPRQERPPLSLPRLRSVILAALLAWVALGLPAGAARADTGDWVSPTGQEQPEVLRPFAAPPAPWAAGHRGVDLAVTSGGSIRAPAGGVVSFSGVVVDREVVSIDHGAGYISSFEPASGELDVGDEVSAGQVVAQLADYIDGSTHCASAPCVHWGVRLHGEYINPLLMLGPLEPSVLLPL